MKIEPEDTGIFANETEFDMDSPARKFAQALVEACQVLDEAMEGWQYSPRKRKLLGLHPEFGAALARHYIDWTD